MGYIYAALWLASGYASFVYWWTKHYDLGYSDAIFGLAPAMAGPFSFVIGWMIHGKDGKTLIAKRKSK